jgi:nitrite reductase/ring-hydroxylating ferredoxin subunit
MERIAVLADIPADGLRFAYKDGPFEEEGILLTMTGGEVRAYKNECRHLLMRLDDRDPGDLWDPSNRYLVCNSHGARYQPSDGLCVSGPCEGSHLRSLPVVVKDDEVFLDTSKIGGFFDV